MSEQREKSRDAAYPVDRFDSVPKRPRVGAHRVVGRTRTAWRWLLAAILVIAVLITAGIIWVNSLGSNPLPRPTTPGGNQSEQVDPQLNPDATVVVLNGTPTQALASGVDEVITESVWGQIVFAGLATTDDVQISAIFYSDAADEAAAEGLAQKLGGMSTYQSSDYDNFGVQLIVLLGADYAGPGFEEAERIAAGLDGEDVAPLDEDWVPPTPPAIAPPPPFVPNTNTDDGSGDTDLPPLDTGDEAGGEGEDDSPPAADGDPAPPGDEGDMTPVP